MPDPSLILVTESHLRALIEEAVRSALGAPSVAQSDILTREQVAELLRVHPAVVTRYTRAKGLPGFKMGREWRFRRAEVMKWLERAA